MLFLLTFLAILLVSTRQWCFHSKFSHTNYPLDVNYSPDQTKIVVGSWDKNHYVYDANNYSVLFPYNVTQTFDFCYSARFSPDGKYLAYALGLGTVTIFNATTYAPITTINTPMTPVYQVDFSPNTDRLIACGDFSYAVYMIPSWTYITGLYLGAQVRSCRFNNNGGFAVGTNNGYTYVMSSSYSQIWTNQRDSNSLIRKLDFSPNSSYLGVAISISSSKALVFNVSSNASQTNMTSGSGARIYAMDWNEDGSVFAYGGNDGKVYINNGTAPNFDNTLYTFDAAPGGTVWSLDFSKSSRWLAVGTNNKEVLIYDRDCGTATNTTNTTNTTSATNATSSNNSNLFSDKFCPIQQYQNGLDSCRLCALDLPGCRQCTNSSVCLDCSDQYYIDGDLCQLCIGALSGCTSCFNSTVCTACLSEYYLESGECLSCIGHLQGCLVCINSTYCHECVDNGYFLNGSSICQVCIQVFDHCLSCNSSQCFNCQTGFFVAGGACSPCQSPCATCSTASSICNGCDLGFYLSGSTCLSCPSSCLECSDSTTCLSCQQGYYLSGSNCQACSQKCSQCASSSSDCRQCNIGYYLSGSSCLPCQNPCSSCIDSVSCLSCGLNFYLVAGNNTCLSCSSLYPQCLQCDQSNCWQCASGFTLINNTCINCAQLQSGCQLCDSNTCVLCLAQFYLSSGVCQPCIFPCLTCFGPKSCLSCPAGYFLDSNSSCLPCSCPSCISAVTCLSCSIGLYLNNGSCLECSSIHDNCISCEGSSTCSSCSAPYYSNAGGCSLCPLGCTSCNGTECFSCDLVHYLDLGACLTCPSGCSSCFSLSNCSLCEIGYYLSNITCLQCSSLAEGCRLCNQSSCLSCDQSNGYNLNGSICSPCSIPNCQICNKDSICLLCQPSFTLNTSNTECIECYQLIPNCQLCSNLSICDLCFAGFYTSGPTCMLCHTGCLLCDSTATCNKCDNLFWLNSSSYCQECASALVGCQQCTSLSVCTSCTFGFYLNGTTCTPCLVNILGCISCFNSTYCQFCQSGFYYDVADPLQCILCSSNLNGCAFCRSASICDLCQGGYYQNNSHCQLCNDPNCFLCDSSNCIDCLSGYYILNGSCFECQSKYSGCIFCNETACLDCQTGYYLSSAGACMNCPDAGCEICNSSDSAQCIHCNSAFYLSTTNDLCQPCNETMLGCLFCSSSLDCLSCHTGYYLLANGSSCQLCSLVIPACIACTGSATCTDCSNGYLLANGSCLLCASLLQGCSLCNVSSVCLSCLQGYYLNSGQLCQRCELMEGCLVCRSGNDCHMCKDGYYLSSGNCLTCASAIEGCNICSSPTLCLACAGSYYLAYPSVCSQLVVKGAGSSTSFVRQLFFVSRYISPTTLSHTLWHKTAAFDFTNIDLAASVSISYLAERGVVTRLTTTGYEWGSKLESIVFYTSNPFDFESEENGYSSMQLFRERRLEEGPNSDEGRMLQESNINLKADFQLSIKQATAALILSSTLTSGGSISLSYNINSPEFIASTLSLRQYYYHYFGWLLTLYLAIFYFIKGVVLLPKGFDKGIMIAHVLLLKTTALSVFPSYAELIDYCSGFMIIDMPWLNQTLSSYLSDPRDSTPQPYRIFYTSLSMSSTYLLALVIFLALLLFIFLSYCLCSPCRRSILNLGLFLYNLFLAGLSLASVACIQGAFLNLSMEFTAKSAFYLLGVVVWACLVVQTLWSCCRDRRNLYKLRIIVKAGLLSLLHYNPLYLCSLVAGTQIFFIFLQSTIVKYLCSGLALTASIFVNAALVTLVILSHSLISIYVASGLTVVTLVLEAVTLYKEFRHSKLINDLKISPITCNGNYHNRDLQVRRKEADSHLSMLAITQNQMLQPDQSEKVGIADRSHAKFFTLEDKY